MSRLSRNGWSGRQQPGPRRESGVSSLSSSLVRRLHVEELEDRQMLAVLTVQNDLDDTLANLAGDGELSLREAIEIANNPGTMIDGLVSSDLADTIDFSVIGTINLTSQLPTITDDLTITGDNQITLDGGGGTNGIIGNGDGFRIFNIDDGTANKIDVMLGGLALTGGDVSGPGGAVRNAEALTLELCTITGNAATGRGGGIYNGGSGMLAVATSTFDGNISVKDGGGVFNLGEATIADSTFVGNMAVDGGGLVARGGGTTAVTGSTFSANTASDDGGGIANNQGRLAISSSTITGNSATGDGGGVYSGGPTTLNKTIVANSTSGGDLGGTMFTGTFNLIESGTADLPITENLFGQDPLLGTLQNNGGPTQTHVTFAGSPAIDAGGPNIANSPTFDQRGAPFHRVADSDGLGGATIDIGAFERQSTDGVSLVVNTNIDSANDGDAATTTLREAILASNALPGPEIITFDAALSGETILLTLGELTISDEVVIAATGLAENVTIDAQQQSRVLRIGDPLVTDGNFDVTLAGLTITGGSAASDGAGVLSRTSGTLALLSSTVSGNSSSDYGGGIRTYSGAVTLLNSTVSGNSSSDHGGGIYTLTGSVTLTNSTISGNSTSDEAAHGGGIYTRYGAVTLTDSTVSGNSTASYVAMGGGIWAYSGTVALTGSTVSGNRTSGEDALGGGIFAFFSAVILIDSTISGNSTSGSGANGGGIYTLFSAVTLTNSTVSGNSTSGFAANGGGIYTRSGVVTLTNSTITENMTAKGTGGGVFVFDTSGNPDFTVESSIIAGNSDLGPAPDLQPDPQSTINVDYSLIGDNTGSGITETTGTGNLLNVAPLLGPLANNGGPTQTHALLPGGPAIDAGDPNFDPNSFHPPLTADQRGTARKFGTIDIGGYEAQLAPSADFDTDGDVDGNDFLAWQRGFGTPNAQRADGNSDDDTDVDASDLAAWQVSYGDGLSALASEPSAVSSQPPAVASHELIDAAMAWELLDAPGDDNAEAVGESLVLEAKAHPSSPHVRVVATPQSRNSYRAVDVSGETNDNAESWLSDDLLEQVFG